MTQQDNQANEQYLTASQVAHLLGTTRGKIGKLLKSGLLPYEIDELDRRAKLIPLSAVRRLQERRVVSPKARTRRASVEATPAVA